MANGHGGKRPGAGRPRKSLAEKQMEGTYGTRRPKVLNMPEAKEIKRDPEPWMSYYGSHTAGAPDAPEIHRMTVDWLTKVGCYHLVHPEYISDYAILKASWYEAQRQVTRLGMYYLNPAREEKKELLENPLINASVQYFKMAQVAWNKIWEIVRQNSEIYFGDNPEQDFMAQLLGSKPGK